MAEGYRIWPDRISTSYGTQPLKMSVEQVGELYRCNICDNEVRVTKVGGGTLVCCGQDMEIIEVHTQSAVSLPDSDS